MYQINSKRLQSYFADPMIKQSVHSLYHTIGFVTAVASSPEPVPPVEWCEKLVIQGVDIRKLEQELAYDSLIVELIEWWDYCIFTFDEGKTLELPNKMGLTATGKPNKALVEFSQGYLRGFDWLSNIWQAVLPDTDENQEASRTLAILHFILARFIDEKQVAKIESELYQQMPDTQGCFDTLATLISGVGMLGQDLEAELYENMDFIEDLEETIEASDEDIFEPASFESESFESEPFEPDPLINPYRNIGRNDLCPCGSGKKFKKCCLH